jgi:hypothetical protein
MHLRTRPFPLATSLLMCTLLGACTNKVTSPSSPQSSLRLSGQITSTVLVRGGTATITFRLENLGSEAVTLGFSSSCQVMLYVRDRGVGQVVYPAGGGWVCATVVTQLVLPAGGAKVLQVEIKAADAAEYPFVALPPGDYDAFARLEGWVEGSGFQLQSEWVQFTVR